jgi:hypothetical protein
MESTQRRYRGHRIEVMPRAAATLAASQPSDVAAKRFELLIDGAPIRYERFSDGTFLLAENAYEWGDNLAVLAEKLIDYRDRAAALQSTGSED